MTYMVTVKHLGKTFWLRSTTWAFREERGDKFETRQQAQAGFDKASQFMVPKIRKAVVIEEKEAQ